MSYSAEACCSSLCMHSPALCTLLISTGFYVVRWQWHDWVKAIENARGTWQMLNGTHVVQIWGLWKGGPIATLSFSWGCRLSERPWGERALSSTQYPKASWPTPNENSHKQQLFVIHLSGEIVGLSKKLLAKLNTQQQSYWTINIRPDMASCLRLYKSEGMILQHDVKMEVEKS